jgi:MFS family permease
MWGKRDLVLVCGGAAVSAFGNSVSLIVLLLHAQRISPLAVSGVLVASMVPVALGAPLAGLLVDRLRNRRLLIGALLLQGLALTGIGVFLDLLPVVLGLLVVQGCGQAVAHPAASSLVPRIVGEDGATRGYSWLSTGRKVGMLVGSAAGALLIAAVGFRSALFVDAGTFLVEALSLVFVRAERDPRGEPGERASVGSDAMAGLAFVRGDRVLLVAVGGMAFAIGCVVLINVADPFYVVDVLHGDAVTMGLLQSCWVVRGADRHPARRAGRLRAGAGAGAGARRVRDRAGRVPARRVPRRGHDGRRLAVRRRRERRAGRGAAGPDPAAHAGAAAGPGVRRGQFAGHHREPDRHGRRGGRRRRGGTAVDVRARRDRRAAVRGGRARGAHLAKAGKGGSPDTVGCPGFRFRAGDQPRTTLPALMQEVHTFSRWRCEEETFARTDWMFGFHRRFVFRWECETEWPKPGPLLQTSHTAATSATP